MGNVEVEKLEDRKLDFIGSMFVKFLLICIQLLLFLLLLLSSSVFRLLLKTAYHSKLIRSNIQLWHPNFTPYALHNATGLPYFILAWDQQCIQWTN